MTARPRRRSTPPPPGPAAPKPSTSRAPAGTSGCTEPHAAPRTATRCGSSASTDPAHDMAEAADLIRGLRMVTGEASGRRAGAEDHGGGLGLAGLVGPADADLVARVVAGQHRLDVRGRRDGLARDRGDLVARHQACLR